MKKLLLATLISSAVLCFSSQVMAGHPGGHKHHGPMHMLKSLDLSDAQRQDIRQIMREFRGDVDSLGEPGDMRDDVKSLIESGNADEATLRSLITQQWESNQAGRVEAAQMRHQIYQVLTVDQQAELAAAQQNKAEKWADKKGKLRERRSPFAKLDLTDEQQSELASLQEANQEQRDTFKTQMKAYSEQEKALIQSAEFSEESWLALDNSVKATAIDARVERCLSHIAMYAVLTDEQRSMLEQMRDDRHEHHMRHKRNAS